MGRGVCGAVVTKKKKKKAVLGREGEGVISGRGTKWGRKGGPGEPGDCMPGWPPKEQTHRGSFLFQKVLGGYPPLQNQKSPEGLEKLMGDGRNSGLQDGSNYKWTSA